MRESRCGIWTRFRTQFPLNPRLVRRLSICSNSVDTRGSPDSQLPILLYFDVVSNRKFVSKISQWTERLGPDYVLDHWRDHRVNGACY